MGHGGVPQRLGRLVPLRHWNQRNRRRLRIAPDCKLIFTFASNSFIKRRRGRRKPIGNPLTRLEFSPSQEKDVDRTISFDRYKELVVEFFTSEDSNTSARHIFGPLELKNIDLALTISSKQ